MKFNMLDTGCVPISPDTGCALICLIPDENLIFRVIFPILTTVKGLDTGQIPICLIPGENLIFRVISPAPTTATIVLTATIVITAIIHTSRAIVTSRTIVIIDRFEKIPRFYLTCGATMVVLNSEGMEKGLSCTNKRVKWRGRKGPLL